MQYTDLREMTGLFYVHQQPWTRSRGFRRFDVEKDITAKHAYLKQCFLQTEYIQLNYFKKLAMSITYELFQIN